MPGAEARVLAVELARRLRELLGVVSAGLSGRRTCGRAWGRCGGRGRTARPALAPLLSLRVPILVALGVEAPGAALSAVALTAPSGDGVPRLRAEELRAQLPLFRRNRRGVVLRRAARREGRDVRRDGAARVVVIEVPPYAIAIVKP